jgi:hypothetical protein
MSCGMLMPRSRQMRMGKMTEMMTVKCCLKAIH